MEAEVTIVGGRELEAALVLGQTSCDRADDRDLEAIEDPDCPQPDDDHPMEA